MLDPGAEDRSGRCLVAELLQVTRAQRAFEHEQLAVYAPRRVTVRLLLVGVRQGQGKPANVVPVGHNSDHIPIDGREKIPG